MPDSSRKKPARKSPYTADRGIPGAFEGETVTRRHFMTGGALAAGGIATAAFALPALGFALGPLFEDSQPERWQDVGPGVGVQRRDLRPGRDEHRPRDRRAGEDHGLRAQVNPSPTTTSATRTSPTWPSPRAACTSAARSATSRPPSASSAPATAACTTSRARSRAARPCARSTASTPGCGPAGSRSATASRSTPSLERFSPRDPSNWLDGLWQYIYPVEAHGLMPPLPKFLRPAPPRPGDRQRLAAALPARTAPAGSTRRAEQGDGGHRVGGRLDRRAHEHEPVHARSALPQGPEGHELVPHARLGHPVRLPLPGRDRRLPGDVLRRRTPRAPTTRRPTSPTRSSSASSSAACTAGARR